MDIGAIAFVHAKPNKVKEKLKKISGVKGVFEILGQADIFVVDLAAKTLPDLYKARERIKSLRAVHDCILEVKLA